MFFREISQLKLKLKRFCSNVQIRMDLGSTGVSRFDGR